MSTAPPAGTPLVLVVGDASQLAARMAPLLDGAVDVLALPADGVPTFRRPAGDALVVALVGPAVAAPLQVARALRQQGACDWIVFLAAPEGEAELRRQLAYALPQADWSMAPADAALAARAVTEALRLVRQRRRFRSTIDRINLRLSERSVDSASYRRLVVAQRYLASILEHATDAIVSVDVRGTVLSWSSGAATLFGIAEDRALGRPLARVAAWEGDGLRGATTAALAGSLQRVELRFRNAPDGEATWVDATLTPVRDDDGHVIGAAAILRDVSARRRIEAEREQLLAAERAARAEVERAARMKDEFLAVLSHELRTPLSAVLGYASVLQRMAAGDQRLRDAADAIARNARAQARMVDELLDMSAMITGKMRLELHEIDPAGPVEAALESVRPGALRKNIKLEAEWRCEGCIVRADPGRLQQIVSNLLTNAIKFTPEGGTVKLLLEARDGQAEVVVEDTGEGIDASVLPHVFERFVQADASSRRQHGGLGLGLSIVRQLVELHGGEVLAESPGPGQGARFTVRLPANPDGEIAAQPQRRSRQAEPLEGLSVLVVDDEPDAREVLRLLLSSLGAQATTAADADQALALLEQGGFDVLLSDISMPGRNGYELVRALRALPDDARSRVPAVAVTAFSRADDRAAALAAGYDAHLPKPIDLPALVTTVADVLDAHRALH